MDLKESGVEMWSGLVWRCGVDWCGDVGWTGVEMWGGLVWRCGVNWCGDVGWTGVTQDRDSWLVVM